MRDVRLPFNQLHRRRIGGRALAPRRQIAECLAGLDQGRADAGRFCGFRNGPSNSRLAFLSWLCGRASLFVINQTALDYMKERAPSDATIARFAEMRELSPLNRRGRIAWRLSA